MGLEDNQFLQKFINFGEKKAGSTTRGILVGLFAAFGGFLFGYDTGTISGILAMDYVKQRFPANKTSGDFSSGEKSLIVSILSVGTFVGSLSSPLFSDRIGRRWTLILSTMIVFNLGIVLQTIATSNPLLIAGRAIAGLGVGLISSVTPLYIAETTPKWIRGAIVSCYQLAITIGLLIAAVANKGTEGRNDSGSYRIPIALQFGWALILSVGMFLLPETPRFWVSKSDEAKAKDSLRRLRKLPVDHPDLIEEYEDIKANFEFEIQFGTSSWAQVFKNVGKQHKRLFMGVFLQAFQQLTGINFIFYYGTAFFKNSGIKNPFTIQMATNIVNVGMTFPGIVLIELIGRRKLLLSGSVVMSIAQLLVASIGVATDSKAANQCLVAFSCIFIAGFAATWGPLGWAVVAESYSLNVRQKSVAISTASNWLWNFAIGYATPYMVDSGKGNANLGSKVFFIWGGCNVIGFLFVYFFVYETKGLSLEQIDEMYMMVDNAWDSAKFIPTEHAFREEVKAFGISEEKGEIEHSVEQFGEKKAGSTTRGILVGLFAAFGGFLFGYDTGTISGILAMDFVKQTFPGDKALGDFSSGEKSLIVSILSVGTFIGALSAPIFSDRIGRRWTLIISTMIVFNIGIVLQTVATGNEVMIAGRAIAGLGVGLISAVVPLYIAETTPKWIRGAIVSSYQWAITIGLLIAAVANKATEGRKDSGSYRIPIALQFAWALILSIGMLLLPETPRFWVSKSNEENAKDSLRRLRKLPIDHPDLIEEYEDIKANFEFEMKYGNSSWAQVFKNVNKQHKRLFMGVCIQALQQLTGINFIFYYGTTFFKSSGIKNAFTIQLATNIVNVGMTVPGIALIELMGRRKLLLSGSVVMAVSQLLVASIGVATDSKSANQCLVAFSCIFIAGFAATWGPLCWAVVAESYALNVRQKSVALCTASNWLWNFAIGYATPYMVDSGKGNANLGSKVFFIWGGFNVVGFLFVYLFVYETKGLSLEQVDEMYMKVDKPWESYKFIPSEHAFREEGHVREEKDEVEHSAEEV
ncbi:hypothetical protein JA1_002578 [Spathaspora sp. JA1]|nr:hypothetical protein JA1_002578 [Spathaspora sp. JA1]